LLADQAPASMGHGILTRINTDYDWNWIAARKEIDSTLVRDPNNLLHGGLLSKECPAEAVAPPPGFEASTCIPQEASRPCANSSVSETPSYVARPPRVPVHSAPAVFRLAVSTMTFKLFQIILGQLAPFLLQSASDLQPSTSDTIACHGGSPHAQACTRL